MEIDTTTHKTNGRKTTNDALNMLLRASAAAMVLLCITAFVCGTARAETIYVPEGGNQTIQQAVDNATAGDTIIVREGTYTGSVDVDVVHLTIRSEHGNANCIVNTSMRHVFVVTADYVNINGLTVKGATSGMAGIYLNGADHCNISIHNTSFLICVFIFLNHNFNHFE